MKLWQMVFIIWAGFTVAGWLDLANAGQLPCDVVVIVQGQVVIKLCPAKK